MIASDSGMSHEGQLREGHLREGHLREGHLREGFTTGSAAAAAARAATIFALTGEAPQTVDIPLPAPHEGRLTIPVADIVDEDLSVRAAVVKDGGDDPDATHGARIEALVTVDPAFSGVGPHVLIGGGRGVGTVTLPGLPVPVGRAAINPAPEAQIRASVLEVLPEGFTGVVLVAIEVPDGEERAKHTLNPRLGIMGGISILGTGGIVRPYSHAAWAACIDAGLDVARAAGHSVAVLTTGRRSERLLQAAHPFVPDICLVQAADFFAHAMRAAAERGFTSVAWAVFPGKLTKQAQGLAYTHARDTALDFAQLGKAASQAGADDVTANAVAGCATAGHAFALLPPDVRTRLAALLAGRAREAALGHSGAALDVRYLVFDSDGAALFADPLDAALFSPSSPLHPGAGSR
jgi:cobalt-precorrin-5B (C1)-methyltransferase